MGKEKVAKLKVGKQKKEEQKVSVQKVSKQKVSECKVGAQKVQKVGAYLPGSASSRPSRARDQPGNAGSSTRTRGVVTGRGPG